MAYFRQNPGGHLRLVSVLVLIVLFPLSNLTVLGAEDCAPAKETSSGPVQVQMHNVMYHFQDGIMVHIRQLGGALNAAGSTPFPVFDNKNSFTLRIASAEMAITPQSMANVLNQHVFSRNDAPLKDISLQIEKGRLKIKGKLHHQGNIGFETESILGVTDDGKIRLQAEKIRAMHLPVKGLMGLFGLDIADLIKTGKVRGVKAEKDDVILDPELALPPPHITGRVTKVLLEGDNIVLVFGEPQRVKWENMAARNYMAYRGNRLQFGKLTMNQTDMVLIDSDPRDPFDFYLDHYKDQLTAGYSKTTDTFGLRVFMVDYNKLNRRTHAQPPMGKEITGSKPEM